MQRRRIASRGAITLALVLQLVPLMLFPPQSFSPTSQEWWLPALLAVMLLVAVFELVVRRSDRSWPWYLISFTQGLNIISRLMMLWPHATQNVNGANVLNGPYIALSLLAMALSVLFLWYNELPDVRIGLLRE